MAASSSSSARPLSVVIPTSRGWPAVEPCLDALLPQAREVDAEVVIADGSGTCRRPTQDSVGLQWLEYPGLGIFDLRLRALQRARGTLLAVTEDHCLPAPDWCQRIIEAHEARPHLQAIKGVVMHARDASAIERAAFLMNHLPHLPPPGTGVFANVLGISCTSFRREAIEALQTRVGSVPPELAGAWLSREAIGSDERIHVTHVQPEPAWETVALQYHNARAIAGRTTAWSRRDWVRVLGAPVLPWTRAARTAVQCWRKRVSRRMILESVPMMVLLYHAKGAGEVAGFLAGPGDSERRIG